MFLKNKEIVTDACFGNEIVWVWPKLKFTVLLSKSKLNFGQTQPTKVYSPLNLVIVHVSAI